MSGVNPWIIAPKLSEMGQYDSPLMTPVAGAGETNSLLALLRILSTPWISFIFLQILVGKPMKTHFT